MKLKNYILLMVASMMMTSCQLEAPEIPAEELYLRSFIKMFGLIDPNQDWNLAERSDITINLPKSASKVVVYAEIFDEYYRVARCYDVAAGVTVIPLDVPVNTTGLAVEVDGEAYLAELGGTLNVSNKKPVSRADGDEMDPIFLDEENILGWVIVAEDLGDTDDVDFNDFVARFSYDENAYYAYGEVTPDNWDVIEQQGGDLYFKDGDITSSRAAEIMSRSREDGNTVVTIKSLASGGILKLYLHFRDTDTDTDYLIGPGSSDNYVVNNGGTIANVEDYEWHRWFGMNDGIMINTADPNKYYNEDEVNLELPAFNTIPHKGMSINFSVPGSFTFSTYSQLTYESYDPTNEYNFNFERHTIEGFYITVRSHAYDSSNPAYDLGKVIGHNRVQGLPPQMFLVPDLCYTKTGENSGNVVGAEQNHFKWPTERTIITTAYPKFQNWVSDGTVTWYQYGREDYVVSDEFLTEIYKD